MLRKPLAILLLTATAHANPSIAFDPASYTILVDSGASQCITNDKAHFIGKPKRVLTKATGIGSAPCTLQGTVRWTWDDDDGVPHTKDIPNT